MVLKESRVLFAHNFIDDIIVLRSTYGPHINDVLQSYSQPTGLTLELSKCNWEQTFMSSLATSRSGSNISTDSQSEAVIASND